MTRFDFHRPSNGTYGHKNGAYINSAPTLLIDDFEDNTLSEYSWPSGGTFQTTTNSTYEGTYSGIASDAKMNIISTSGLPNYPGPGDSFVGHVYQYSNPDNSPGMCFGASDGSNCYALDLHGSGELRFYKFDAGTRTTVTKTAATWSDTTWYRLRVDWGSSNSFTLGAYNASTGSKVAEMTATDTTHTATGFGWRRENWAGSSTAAMMYDKAYIL